MKGASSPPAGIGADRPGPRFSMSGPRPSRWSMRDRVVELDRPVVMGILNMTPDSFSDGGELPSVGHAVDRAAVMIRDGAGILDVGGESTRPGADPVPLEQESERVVPVIEALVGRFDVPVSVDTRKGAVARAALAAGGHVVNDVSGFRYDPAMARVVADSGAGGVLMHMRGKPSDMQERAVYDDVVQDVAAELRDLVRGAEAAGVERERLVVDPGLGFAKTAAHNLLLLRRLDELAALGLPVLVGPSRKSFLGTLLRLPPARRVNGTTAACVLALVAGARIFRVHDVGPTAEALAVAHAVVSSGR